MLTVKMVLERETKGAIRFQEVDDNGNPVGVVDGKIGTLYVRKSALNGNAPKAITVTVE